MDGVVGPYGLGIRNDRGTRLVEFCQENNLVITNTWFKLPKRRLYTWKSPQGTTRHIIRNQIDYVTINSRFKNSILSAKAYPGCDINSDHNPVAVIMRLKLKKIIVRKPKDKIAWTTANDVQLQQYREYVDEQLETRAQENTPDSENETDIENTWTSLKETIVEAGETKIGKQDPRKRKPWMTDGILNLMEERRREKNRNHQKYTLINREVEKQIQAAKEDWLDERCREAEQLQEHHKDRELHQKIKEIAGLWKPKNVSIIENENRDIELDPEKQKQIWEKYLLELFADKRPEDSRPIEKGDTIAILTAEVIRAIKEIKGNKAPGEDSVVAEHFKHLSEAAINRLTHLFNNIYETGILPRDWLSSTFVAIPKKNKARRCEDHRTISLMSHAAKIFMRIIYNRIHSKCDAYLSRSQYGFRRGTGAREAILGLTLLAERYLEVQRKLYVCFVDYRKAFDRIKHDKLVQILHEIGLEGREITIIRNIYWNHIGCVRTESGNTNYVSIKRGVRQGCLLSPLLFNVYAEHIIKTSLEERSEGARVNGVVINNIRYADDTVVLAESEEHLQTLMNVLAVSSARMGLEINALKTRTLVFDRNPNVQNNVGITIDNTKIQNVNSYIYLGREVNSQLDHTKEIRRRIEIARTGFVNMRKFLCHPNLNTKVRLRTLKCYVWSLLLYGCETWTLKKEDLKRLQAFEMWLYRRMLRISWTSRTTNMEVLGKMNTQPLLVQTIKMRKTAYLGHLMRHTEYEQLQLILEGKIDGRRGLGRKKKSWLRNIRDWTNTNGNDLIHVAQNRDEFAVMVANLK